MRTSNYKTILFYLVTLAIILLCFYPNLYSQNYKRVICGLNAKSSHSAHSYSQFPTKFASLPQSNQVVQIMNKCGLWPMITEEERRRGRIQPSLVFTNRGENAIVTRLISGNTFTKPVIVIDSVWAYSIAQSAGTSWVITAIYAHELAHIYFEHIYDRSNKDLLDQESEADWFAGYALCNMGATLEEAQSILPYISEYQEKEYSDAHPSYQKRMQAIKEGFLAANCKIQRLEQSINDIHLYFMSSKFDAVTVEVENKRYLINQYESVHIPLTSKSTTIRIWHCPQYNCDWVSYNIYAGNDYQIVDGKILGDLILVK